RSSRGADPAASGHLPQRFQRPAAVDRGSCGGRGQDVDMVVVQPRQEGPTASVDAVPDQAVPDLGDPGSLDPDVDAAALDLHVVQDHGTSGCTTGNVPWAHVTCHPSAPRLTS